MFHIILHAIVYSLIFSTHAQPSTLFEQTVDKYIQLHATAKDMTPITLKPDELPKYDKIREDIKNQFDSSSMLPGNKLNTAYALIKDHVNKEIASDCFISKNFEQKIELVNNTLENTLISKLNRTQTSAGKLTLVKLLTSPSFNIVELQKRQGIVKKLVENPALRSELNDHLRSLKDLENTLLFMQQPHQKNIGDLKMFLYPLHGAIERFNQSPKGMQSLFALHYASRIWGVSICPATAAGIYFSQKKLSLEYKAYLTGLAALEIFSIYSHARDLHTHHIAISSVHKQLVDIANYVRHAKQLAHLVHETPALNNSFGHLAHSIFNGSAKFESLLELLGTKTFDSVSFFSLSGRILAARSLLQETIAEFAPMMHFVGLVDAYASCAQLYLDHVDYGPATFAFAQYMPDAKPIIEAKNFWNPFIDREKVIMNFAHLGDKNAHTMIVTGPNTGGKSTIIKGLLINVWLGQTIGIVPAESFSFTPFKVLNCMLNITDDIANNISMFQAEINAAKQILEQMNQADAQNGEFVFTIMDELFHGTNQREGSQAAKSFTKKIGEPYNSLCVVATHYDEVTQLEKEHMKFKNYHVKAYKKDGAWVKPYQLFAGISESTNALDLLHEQGVL